MGGRARLFVAQGAHGVHAVEKTMFTRIALPRTSVQRLECEHVFLGGWDVYREGCAWAGRLLYCVSTNEVRSTGGAKARTKPARLAGFRKSRTCGGVSHIFGMTQARPTSKDLRTLPMMVRSAPSSASSSSRSASLIKPCGVTTSSVFQSVAISMNLDRLPGRAGLADRAKG